MPHRSDLDPPVSQLGCPVLYHPYNFKRPHTLHKAHKESDLLINSGNFLLIVTLLRCQLSYPGFSQLNRSKSAFQSKTIDSLCLSLLWGASCPDLWIQAAQAKRAATGAWRRDMAALTGVTRLLATAAALTFICQPQTHTNIRT
jgi:hypothetical protein